MCLQWATWLCRETADVCPVVVHSWVTRGNVLHARPLLLLLLLRWQEGEAEVAAAQQQEDQDCDQIRSDQAGRWVGGW
jgi:hypothetical protein